MLFEQMEREVLYRIALSFAHQWFCGGLIDAGEYGQIDAVLRDKFSPVWGNLTPLFVDLIPKQR